MNTRLTTFLNGFKHFSGAKMLVVASVVTVAAVASIVGVNFANRSSAAASCDKVNIVYCGTHSVDQFKQVYNSNKSGHATSPTVKKDYTDLHTIYSAFGISSSSVTSMSSSNTVSGTVYRDGRVVVDGKVVGTGAKVAARFEVPGATKIAGTNAYIRNTSDSFQFESRKALVRMENGKMKYAILVDCGNPVTATPPPTPPTPVYTCDILTIKKQLNRTTFEFEAKGSVKNGATITGYRFDFGDGKKNTVSSNQTTATTNHSYEKAGSYTTTVTLLAKVDGKDKESITASCKAKVAVKSEECKPGVPVGSKECEDYCEVPGKEHLPKNSPDCKEDEVPPTTTTEETPPTELPKTGASAAIAGFAGLSSIGGAAAYYARSRRSLKDLLLNR